ncbi:MAG TPA: twin-arginine translocase subunit TatB, partial [Mycoplana sp.]|nr:twin-arginine translocase subunit TatB [Mycoplana sp.]
EFRQQFDEALREADLDDVRKTIGDAQKLNPMNAIRDAVNPLRQMGDDIKSDLQKATSISQVESSAASSLSTEPPGEAQPAVTENGAVAPAAVAAASATAASPVTAAPVQPVKSAPINPVEATAKAIEQAATAKRPATTKPAPVAAAEAREPEKKPARKPSSAKAPAKSASAAKAADKVAKPASKSAGEAAKKATTRKPKKDQA